MFLNSWSIALVICSLVVLFLMVLAARSAIRVLFFWNPESDANRQIRLENEIWLTSTLVECALAVQILSLVVFVLAADYFSNSIAGAMCATGSLLANDFGVPALLVKIGGVFFYGFWIVLHQIDIRSERYPLVRIKYIYLLLVFPLLILDIVLVMIYIGGLEPDIITSCCAVVFDDAASGGTNLLSGLTHGASIRLFYGTTLVIVLTGVLLICKWRTWMGLLFGSCWAWYFVLALMVITTVFSPYIYAMPFHKCPFCILKPEYYYIGFLMYSTLFIGAFFGMSTVIVEPLKNTEGLGGVVSRFQQVAVRVALVMVIIFAFVSSYYYLRYLIVGGEG